jgi:hypothetical protein
MMRSEEVQLSVIISKYYHTVKEVMKCGERFWPSGKSSVI